MRILALEKDLFFSVKIRDTLKHHDIEALTVRNVAAFEQKILTAGEEGNKIALAIINIGAQGIDWEAAIRIAHEQNLPVLAFGSHMDLEARERALRAGAQKVVANSKFSSDMYGLITRLLANATDIADKVDEEEDATTEA